MKQENNHFWIGGKNTVQEIIKSKKRKVKKLLLTKNNQLNLEKITSRLKSATTLKLIVFLKIVHLFIKELQL